MMLQLIPTALTGFAAGAQALDSLPSDALAWLVAWVAGGAGVWLHATLPFEQSNWTEAVLLAAVPIH